jgi:hypothetical protein
MRVKNLWLFPCFFIAGLGGCGTGKALEDPPIITSATHQHTLYNGKPQPIEAAAAKPGAPFVITYFPSLEALERNEGGTLEAPAAVGDYYARIERPAGNGYAGGRPIPVEYHIQKGFVTITAGEKQEAVYDGAPKQISASADPPVPLVITYYPGGTPSGGAAGPALEGPPAGPGLYYVKVSYPGDENYRGASKDVEFSIGRK